MSNSFGRHCLVTAIFRSVAVKEHTSIGTHRSITVQLRIVSRFLLPFFRQSTRNLRQTNLAGSVPGPVSPVQASGAPQLFVSERTKICRTGHPPLQILLRLPAL